MSLTAGNSSRIYKRAPDMTPDNINSQLQVQKKNIVAGSKLSRIPGVLRTTSAAQKASPKKIASAPQKHRQAVF